MNIKIRHKSFEYYLGAATPCMFILSAIFWRKHCIRSGSYSVLYILLLLGLPILHLGYSYIVLLDNYILLFTGSFFLFFFINKKVTTDAKVVLRSICFIDTYCCLLCTCPLSMCFRWQFAIYFQDYANPRPRPGMLIIYTACWVIFQAFVIC